MVQSTKFPKTKVAFEAAYASISADIDAGRRPGPVPNARYPNSPHSYPSWQPAYTSTTSYYAWQSSLNHYYWHNVVASTGDVFQLNFLRAIAVAGVEPSEWITMFYKFNEGRDGWGAIKKRWLGGYTVPQVDDFFQLVVNESCYRTHYPVEYPEWLVSYGFTQQQYLCDLSNYWLNVADEYYKLWPDTRYGVDTPEIAAIRRIGREARQEIEALDAVTYGYLPYSDLGDDYVEDDDLVDEEEVYW